MIKNFILLILAFSLSDTFSQIHWIQTEGPKSASILYVTFNQQGYIYCGTDGAGIYYSTNSGVSWTNMPNSPVRVKTIAFGLNGYIFAGMEYPGAGNSGLFRSTDNGNKWDTLSMLPTECVFHKGNGLILAGVNGGIMKSTNNGINWVHLTAAIENSSINTIDTSGIYIFAGGYYNGKIFRSSDLGSTWQRIYFNGMNDHITKIETGANSNVYAGINGRGLFYTSNYGTNWAQMNYPSYNSPLDIEIINDVIHCADNYTIYFTTNHGTNWLQTDNCIPFSNNGFFTDMAFRSSDNLYIGSSGPNAGLFIKGFEYDCRLLSSDFVNSSITAMTSLPNGPVFATTRHSYIYKTTNSGNLWAKVNTSTSSYPIRCMTVDSQYNIYAGGENGYYRSTDNGNNWSFINSVFNNKQIYRMICTPNGSIFAATWYGPIYRSTNNGGNWSSIIDIDAANMAVSPQGVLFACNASNADLYRSTNNGESWELLSQWVQFHIIYSLIVCPNNNLFVGTANGTYLSTNLGNNWTQIPLLHETNLFAVNRFGYMYAYDEYRRTLHRSTNYGLPGSWTAFTTGLPLNIIYALVVDKDDYLLAGTYGRGVYRTAVTTVLPKNKSVPLQFKLCQNYPNPFNPSTKIKFSLPSPSKGGVMDVKLVVYDVLGREIANLIPPLWGGKVGLSPGTYEVEWDGLNYPSGVYFYQLSINNEQLATRKMVLVK